jgi:hypothetical protein
MLRIIEVRPDDSNGAHAVPNSSVLLFISPIRTFMRAATLGPNFNPQSAIRNPQMSQMAADVCRRVFLAALGVLRFFYGDQLLCPSPSVVICDICGQLRQIEATPDAHPAPIRGAPQHCCILSLPLGYSRPRLNETDTGPAAVAA